LDAHRYFNADQPFLNEPTTIEILPPNFADRQSHRLSFKITDPDGLHQAQLFTTVEYLNGHDLSILDCKSLDDKRNIVAEFLTTPVTLTADTIPLPVITDSVILRVIDAHGNFTQKKIPLYSPEDVNRDGRVNIQDLVLVAANFGEQGKNSADVNGDGVVNIADLVLVAGALGNTMAAL
jgi:hypothetical protein